MVDGLRAKLFGLSGQMRVDAGGGGRAVAQPLLDQAQVDAGFQQLRGPRMTQRVHGSALVKAAIFERGVEGLLDAALGHRLSRLRQVDVVTTFGGKEQHGIAMCLPVVAQQLQRAFGQRHVTIFRAFAVADVNHQAGAVDVGDLQISAFLQPQAAGVDGLETNLVARQSEARENLAHLFLAEDDRQFLFPAPDERCRRWPSYG